MCIRDSLLDFGKRETEELLELLDPLDALHVFGGIEAEAALHPLRGIQESLFLVIAKSALCALRAFGSFADLEIFLALGVFCHCGRYWSLSMLTQTSTSN